MARTRDIKHGEYTWHYRKADLEQGAYSVSDPDGQKVAVILPFDRSKPIEHRLNARLFTREFGSSEWEEKKGVYGLKEAMTIGNQHIHRYQVLDQQAHALRLIREQGLTREELNLINDLLTGSESSIKDARSNEPSAPSILNRIRASRRRRERESERGKDRDDGRGRD